MRIYIYIYLYLCELRIYTSQSIDAVDLHIGELPLYTLCGYCGSQRIIFAVKLSNFPTSERRIKCPHRRHVYELQLYWWRQCDGNYISAKTRRPRFFHTLMKNASEKIRHGLEFHVSFLFFSICIYRYCT